MLRHRLLEFDEKMINYQKEWEKTVLFKIFKIKHPTESWKIQLIRVLKRKHKKKINMCI